ncbi:hypothetical protein Tco_0856435 [Tanacetum coccineum]|uniref:Uncharacterized protein n=1 Tax=Tanacetum coccineum TaxID=301880 RepID=A0ABQ5B788_9ASTR
MTDFIISSGRHGYKEAFKALVLIKLLPLMTTEAQVSQGHLSFWVGAEDETPPFSSASWDTPSHMVDFEFKSF